MVILSFMFTEGKPQAIIRTIDYALDVNIEQNAKQFETWWLGNGPVMPTLFTNKKFV